MSHLTLLFIVAALAAFSEAVLINARSEQMTSLISRETLEDDFNPIRQKRETPKKPEVEVNENEYF
jgi:hypothetical protein